MSKKGLIIGIILVITGIAIIFLVQIKTTVNKEYLELYKDYTDVQSRDPIDENNNGKIIATNGKMTIPKELIDIENGIHIFSIKLRRNVEIYQWIKKCKDEDCSYKKIWSNKLIDSTNYDAGYENPDSKKYETIEFIAEEAKIGNYYLTKDQIKKVDYDKKIDKDELVQEYNSSGFETNGNYFYESNNINNPDIGDIRISYDYVDVGNLSVLAIQNGNTFEPLKDNNNNDIYIIEKGKYNGKQLLDKTTNSSTLLRILLRTISGLIIIVGIRSIIIYFKEKKLLEKL